MVFSLSARGFCPVLAVPKVADVGNARKRECVAVKAAGKRDARICERDEKAGTEAVERPLRQCGAEWTDRSFAVRPAVIASKAIRNSEVWTELFRRSRSSQ